MKEIAKQLCGIDVSQKELVISLTERNVVLKFNWHISTLNNILYQQINFLFGNAGHTNNMRIPVR